MNLDRYQPSIPNSPNLSPRLLEVVDAGLAEVAGSLQLVKEGLAPGKKTLSGLVLDRLALIGQNPCGLLSAGGLNRVLDVLGESPADDDGLGVVDLTGDLSLGLRVALSEQDDCHKCQYSIEWS
jgi:hypothetical protein